jgi:hypothetical protein
MMTARKPIVLAVAAAVAAGAAGGKAAQGEGGAGAAPPPFEFKWLPGWKTEHVAFTWGNAGKPLGGASRWAVGGGTIQACYPADHAASGRIYFVDKRRQVWLMDKGEIWPVAGTGDLGFLNGPAEYARFCGSGVYGGNMPGVVASGYCAYISDGGLRRISRGPDGRWKVELAGGGGKARSLSAGEKAGLADLAGIGQLTGDAKGNLYFVLGGGLAKADAEGNASLIISRDKVNADLAAVYARKWPDAARPNPISLGSGEGCSLAIGPDGAVYGGGRTWPSAWKVTADGVFVPLVNYAPKDRMVKDRRWGAFEPATYEPHCCMGWGITSDGHVLMMNEIPFTLSRCEFDRNRVTVMMPDGTFALEGTPWRPTGSFGLRPDGSHVCNAPGPFPSRSSWIRMVKED